MKELAELLMIRHGSGVREELLGCAKWQHLVSMSGEAVRSGGLADSYQSEAGKLGGQKAKTGSPLHEQPKSVLKNLTKFVHEGQPLLVSPSGLAVRLPDALSLSGASAPTIQRDGNADTSRSFQHASVKPAMHGFPSPHG